MRTDGEFRALLVLLADEEERVANVAWETLFDEGAASVPYLQEAVKRQDPRLRDRARLLLEELRLSTLEEQWRLFSARPDDDLDLETGCLLLSRLVGDVDEASVKSFLDAMADMVKTHGENMDLMAAMGEVLFDNLCFRGGEYTNPENHYLTTVLGRRTGVPIALCAVYQLVGRRVGLRISGVAMPGRYLARFDRPDGPCFIDCYTRGRTYSYDALASLLEGRGVEHVHRYLAPSTDRFTLYRMLNNLVRVYTEADDSHMVEIVERLRSVLWPEA